MRKNLFKIVTVVATSFSTLYWGVLPAFADTNIDLCQSSVGGITPPGCAGIDLGKIIQSIISLLLFVAFIVALVFLIIGGIKWIMSGGDKEGAGKAKETVTSALIGLAIVLAAWVLINIVIQLLTGKSLSQIGIPTFTVK